LFEYFRDRIFEYNFSNNPAIFASLFRFIGQKYQNMAVLSKFYKVATVKNTTFAVVAVAVLWTLARKASANQRRRFWWLPVCFEHFL